MDKTSKCRCHVLPSKLQLLTDDFLVEMRQKFNVNIRQFSTSGSTDTACIQLITKAGQDQLNKAQVSLIKNKTIIQLQIWFKPVSSFKGQASKVK